MKQLRIMLSLAAFAFAFRTNNAQNLVDAYGHNPFDGHDCQLAPLEENDCSLVGNTQCTVLFVDPTTSFEQAVDAWEQSDCSIAVKRTVPGG